MIQKVRVFFAWQSDLPNKTNRSAIKNALEKVSKDLKKRKIELYIDEATRDTVGSNNIPNLIRDKIEKADIFIADVSIINNTTLLSWLSLFRRKQRKTPNPNVTFELGYAASELGWDRIILLFNKNFGNADDLPFDFDRHRLMSYFLSNKSKDSDKVSLLKTLEAGIFDIIKAEPLKPIQQRNLNPAQLMRERDIKNLKWLLKTIHIPTLEEFISDLPYKFNSMIFFFSEEFNGITNSSLFHIHDETVKSVIKELHISWNEALSHGDIYDTDKETGYHYFYPPPNRALTKKEEESIKKIESARIRMRKSLKKLQEIIRTKYVDIDPSVESQEAIKSYRLFYKD